MKIYSFFVEQQHLVQYYMDRYEEANFCGEYLSYIKSENLLIENVISYLSKLDVGSVDVIRRKNFFRNGKRELSLNRDGRIDYEKFWSSSTYNSKYEISNALLFMVRDAGFVTIGSYDKLLLVPMGGLCLNVFSLDEVRPDTHDMSLVVEEINSDLANNDYFDEMGLEEVGIKRQS